MHTPALDVDLEKYFHTRIFVRGYHSLGIDRVGYFAGSVAAFDLVQASWERWERVGKSSREGPSFLIYLYTTS
jgi:hypothetical protein